MAFYKCDDCGVVFSEDDVGRRCEYVIEFWGSPAYNDVECCPSCRSENIDEVNEEEFDESDLWEGEE